MSSNDLVVSKSLVLEGDDIPDMPPPEVIPDEDIDDVVQGDDDLLEPEESYEEEDLSVNVPPMSNVPSHSTQQSIPDQVKAFLLNFYRHVTSNNEKDLQVLYDTNFGKLTETYFKETSWPTPERVANIFHDDDVTTILYRELYFRHIYDRLTPTAEMRTQAWNNYVELFTAFQNAKESGIVLPRLWLWDLFDSFVCQLADERRKYVNFKDDNSSVWSVVTAIGFLQSLVNKTKIHAFLQNKKETEIVSPFFRFLGFFSLVSQLHLQCLLCDYVLALQPISDFANALHSTSSTSDLRREFLLSVPACCITFYYYLGFAYMMSRRYLDAGKAFVTALWRILRMKQQVQSRSYWFDQVLNDKTDKLFALLAISSALCPQSIDTAVHVEFRERFADKIQRTQKGELNCFAELFTMAAPKFFSPIDRNTSLLPQQLSLFMVEMRQQALLPVLRSHLKLYTSISIKKLATYFTDIDEATLRTHLHCYKHKSRSMQNGSHVDNSASAEIDFYIDRDMVHVSARTVRQPPAYFMRKLTQMSEQLSNEQML